MKDQGKFVTGLMYTATAILLLFPIWLYLIGVFQLKSCKIFLNENNWQVWLIILSLFVILLNFLIIFLYDLHQFKTFKNEIFYLLKNGKAAWIMGLAISNLFIALYFLIPALPEVDRFNTSFGIFLGILAIFLGIHILYEKDAPIIGTLSLLEKVNKDLNSFKGGNIYFVFPALNFGFYTEAVLNKRTIFAKHNDSFTFFKNSSLAADLYIEMNDIKTIKSNVCKSTSKAIVYDDSEENNYVKKLYMTYHYMISKDEECQNLIIGKKHDELMQNINSLNNDVNVIDCINSAKLFTAHFETTKVKPNELMQPVIVIGDIIYFIADYGMPIFNETKNYFVPLKKEGNPVDLICWRRVDAALAKSIVNHIDNFIENKNNNIKTVNSNHK